MEYYVKAIYDGNRCAVVDSTGHTDWFDVKSGVKQGCNMSGFVPACDRLNHEKNCRRC